MKLTTLATSASIALLSTVAFAQSGPLDADNDGMLTEAEFEAAGDMGMMFSAMDSDGDGMISEAEYNDGARAQADEDNSNSLDPREADRYDELARMFSQERADRDAFVFGDADTNADGVIDEDERGAFDGS